MTSYIAGIQSSFQMAAILDFYHDTKPRKLSQKELKLKKKMSEQPINDYFHGNLPDLEMCLGDAVSWHLAGKENDEDIHTSELVEMIVS